MQYKDKTIDALTRCKERSGEIRTLLGMDGFVDIIVHPVDQRNGPGDDFKPIATITDFAQRIGSAAGKSANIELAPMVEKLGGNGPIMAHAQCAHGIAVRYLGALGTPAIHHAFEELAEATQAISIADPGVTHAAEFSDGKILFGSTASLEAITWEALCVTPGESALVERFNMCDLAALVNWTMIPHMTPVLEGLLEHILPKVDPSKKRRFFFDLADPQKRCVSELRKALEVFARFEAFGPVTLGLNLREAEQVDALLGFEPLDYNAENLPIMASRIREKCGLHTVVIHPVADAACATPAGSFYTTGPFCEKPKITTGAGDHFNAGFMTAQTLGLGPEESLTVAVANSGFYVREAKSPSLDDVIGFLRDA
jgi:hypothetical protein